TPKQKTLVRVLRRDARDLDRIDDDCTLLFEDVDSLRHDARLLRSEGIESPTSTAAPAAAASICGIGRRTSGSSGRRVAFLKGCSRDPDTRGFETIGFEIAGVVAPWRWSALAGRGIVWVGRGALECTQHDGGVRHGLCHRPGGVLIGGDGDDAVAADAADG